MNTKYHHTKYNEKLCHYKIFYWIFLAGFLCQKFINMSSPLFFKKNAMHENSRILGAMVEAVANFSQDFE